MIPAVLFSVTLAQGFTIMTSFWLVYWQEYKWPYGTVSTWASTLASASVRHSPCSARVFSMAVLNYFASVRLHRSAYPTGHVRSSSLLRHNPARTYHEPVLQGH